MTYINENRVDVVGGTSIAGKQVRSREFAHYRPHTYSKTQSSALKATHGVSITNEHWV